MVLPSNPDDGASQPRRADNTLIKALARAYRWKRMLDAGEFATIAELAERERITMSYVTRILQLTRLAPGIVEAILDGRHDGYLEVELLRTTLPDDWGEQRRLLDALS